MAFDYRDKIEYGRGTHHIKNYMDDEIILFKNPEVRRKVKRDRLEKNINVKDKIQDLKHKLDYPAVSVLCCVNEKKLGKKRHPKFYYGESANKAKSVGYKNSVLLKGFSALGTLWDKSKTSNNPIGNCAEQHAAEQLLNNNCKCGIRDIFFSSAFRPRTDEVIPYCENCKKLFF